MKARREIEPFRAMQVVARANVLAGEGRDIIHLCLGQPSAKAPAPALAAAARLLEKGVIGYTPSRGLESLRIRIAKHCAEHYGTTPDIDRIFVTTGSSAAFVLTFLSAFEPGDAIAIPAPGYPAYRNILRALGMEPVEIRTSAASRWTLDAELLSAAYAATPFKGVLVANPNNPNGTMMTPAAFEALAERARELDVRLISDEIYHGLTYAQPEISALTLDDEAYVINSFSKYFCMTGWRIGWMVVPEGASARIDRFQQNLYICAPEIAQVAAEAAFDATDEMELVKAGYRQNRDIILKKLPELGMTEIQPADGAFYVYANTSPTGFDSTELAAALLEDVGVAVTPGIDFDPAEGQNWLRFSYCADRARLIEGLDRVQAWLERA